MYWTPYILPEITPRCTGHSPDCPQPPVNVLDALQISSSSPSLSWTCSFPAVSPFPCLVHRLGPRLPLHSCRPYRHIPLISQNLTTPLLALPPFTYSGVSRPGSRLEATSSASPPSLPQQKWPAAYGLLMTTMTAFLRTRLTAFYSSHLAGSPVHPFGDFANSWTPGDVSTRRPPFPPNSGQYPSSSIRTRKNRNR